MKKFLIKLSYTVFPVWILTVMLVAFYYWVITPNMQGDLGRLGKMPTKLYYERPVDYTVTDSLYITISDANQLRDIQAEVLVCGDSFSGQKIGGYHNYIAAKGLSLANYHPYGIHYLNPFQLAYQLMNMNYLDSTSIKTLIVESVERYLVVRLRGLDLNNDTLPRWTKGNSTKNASPLIETKNYLQLNIGLVKSPMFHYHLEKDFFTGLQGNELYVYHEDLEYDLSIKNSFSQRIRSNIDRLFAKAEEKNIHLIILVCPDKYDLYQEYITNPHPAKTINEDFRRIVGDTMNVVIAKEQLIPEIRKGTKDLYYWDDTHWSYKSARIIGNYLYRIIEKYK